MSWTSLFSKDNTQHIILSRKLKEAQFQMHAQYFNPLYLHTDTYKDHLCPLLLFAGKTFAAFDNKKRRPLYV